jgi:hypothetical protein
MSMLCAPAVLGAATGDAVPALVGTYLEARTADIYTGPCFANSEMNLAGKEATLAWTVERGSFDGVALDGLSVVAVLHASSTLGDPYGDGKTPRSVMVVDADANEAQRAALLALAHEQAGDLLDDVVAIEILPVEMRVADHGSATLQAGDIASLSTRSLHDGDHLCGNEEVFYPPLVDLEHAHPAVTLEHEWRGSGLGRTWKSPHKRSAFVGSFSR